ncbi:MAG: tetratricopeptide repeat protein [Acidobacteria bacterium]|nr:tetratricopeptide repeat protein [Acidobacteriota bacterium]
MSFHKLGTLALACALFLSPFAPAAAAAGLASPPAARQDDTPGEAEQAAFTRGQNLYNQNRYDQAATAFRDFLKNYPNSIITDLTLLWLGRTYIALNRIKDAEGVAQQLRTIKDTPFVEIYEGELQAARREQRASAAPTPAAPQPTPAASMIGRVTPGRRGGGASSRSPSRTPATRRISSALRPICPRSFSRLSASARAGRTRGCRSSSRRRWRAGRTSKCS